LLRAGRERARRGRGRDERGSALVEAVIIFPLVMLLTFGAIEFCIGFSQKGGLESIARTGARTGATLAADATVDIAVPSETPDNSIGVETVQAINAALASSSLPEMKRVVVYRIENLGGGATVDYGPTGWGDACGSYCMVFDFNGTDFDLVTGGAWPIDDRNACGTEPDRIGVRIEGRFNFLTGLFGASPIEMTATSIVQLEPTADC
jgi:hypothetical protein